MHGDSMRGSRKFRQGVQQVSLTKKSSDSVFFFFFFFSPHLIFTEVKWSISKKSIIFQSFRGVPTFSRGRGRGPTFSNCLFPIETHITCDFPGGSGPPVPPLDPHLDSKGQQEHRQARHICTTTSLTAKGSPI